MKASPTERPDIRVRGILLVQQARPPVRQGESLGFIG